MNIMYLACEIIILPQNGYRPSFGLFNHTIGAGKLFLWPFKILSGVARTFPGGRLAHPKDQIEEENEEE